MIIHIDKLQPFLWSRKLLWLHTLGLNFTVKLWAESPVLASVNYAWPLPGPNSDNYCAWFVPSLSSLPFSVMVCSCQGHIKLSCLHSGFLSHSTNCYLIRMCHYIITSFQTPLSANVIEWKVFVSDQIQYSLSLNTITWFHCYHFRQMLPVCVAISHSSLNLSRLQNYMKSVPEKWIKSGIFSLSSLGYSVYHTQRS